MEGNEHLFPVEIQCSSSDLAEISDLAEPWSSDLAEISDLAELWSRDLADMPESVEERRIPGTIKECEAACNCPPTWGRPLLRAVAGCGSKLGG